MSAFDSKAILAAIENAGAQTRQPHYDDRSRTRALTRACAKRADQPPTGSIARAPGHARHVRHRRSSALAFDPEPSTVQHSRMSAGDQNEAVPNVGAAQGSNGSGHGVGWPGLLLWLMAITLTLATIASYLGAWWWGLALIAHFRPHLAAASFIALAAGLLRDARLVTGLGIALLAINAAPLSPYLVPAFGMSSLPPANLRVLTYNMHGDATDRAIFRELIRREQPDLVALSEISGDVAVLAGEIPELPSHRTGEIAGLLYGVALFSRWPVTDWVVAHGPDDVGSVLRAELCTSERWQGCLRVVALHAAPPFGADAAIQSQQLELAARLSAEAPGRRVVLVGDLALTPWSPSFADLLARGNLVDTGRHRGLVATWLSRVPFVGLLIDHVLVSPGVATVDSRVGGDAGSTHLPVIADLAIPLTAP